MIGCAWTSQIAAGPREKEQPYALLYGTCVTDQGFTLREVKVRVELQQEGKAGKGKKKWEMLSNSRGEFAVRLPAGRNTYRVLASKKGFESTEKVVTFEGEERQDLIVTLVASPDKK
ncbi:MAG: carboxypeptidase-like regulatory domain-containing protein [Acidobacteriota bacterium]